MDTSEGVIETFDPVEIARRRAQDRIREAEDAWHRQQSANAPDADDDTFYDPAKIVAARRRAGLRQNTLAKLVGISAAHLCNIENGKVREPGADILGRIAQKAGCTVADFERETATV